MTIKTMSGVKPTGALQLGNELGMNIADLTEDDFLMLADGHAMTANKIGGVCVPISDLSYAMTADLLALGCKARIYRQTHITETFSLYWALSSLVTTGMLDRMHACKAAQDKAELNAGTYTYGILMAADILVSGAEEIWIGRDQAQHLELARILAQRCNVTYGTQFGVSKEVIQEMPTVPGLDGRKMSKSYGNTIPSICGADEIKKLVYQIKTDSKTPEEPKEPEIIYGIYEAIASAEESAELLRKYQAGISWKEAKDILIERLKSYMSGREEARDRITKCQIDAHWQRSRELFMEQSMAKEVHKIYI